jgi:uncharacterized glyoxalase superfamily protein PhnB
MPESDATRERHRTITPYLIADDGSALIRFITDSFGGVVLTSEARPDGGVGHTEMRIGDSTLMLSGATEQWRPRPASLHLYVADADATYSRALRAGARSIMDPSDQPYGDRMGGVEDPAGNHWWIASPLDDGG